MSFAGPSRSLRLHAQLRHGLAPVLRAPCHHSSSSLGLTFPMTMSRRALSSAQPLRFPRMTPRAGSGAEEHPQRISATESWMRNMQERDREQEQREQEREQRESTWNKYGRREPIRSFWRPVAFTVGFSYIGYITAATWTNMDAEEWLEKGRGRLGRQPTDAAMMNAKRMEEAKKAQDTLKTLPSVLSFLPNFILVPILRTYIMVAEHRINSPNATRTQAELIAIFGTVFICWKLRSLQPFMTRWFVHNPIAWTKRQDWRNSFTMLTSTFSHMDLAHIAFNSIALYSFGSAAYMYLATPAADDPHLPTTTHAAHFIAFFCIAGVFSGLGSHLVNNLVRLPRLVRALRSPARLSPTHALAAHHAINPSLGASGAVYACVTMVALAYPDSDVSIIFLPIISIPMPVGVLGMVAVDIIGILRGWRHLDHIAHLGGALFGVFYYFEGKKLWNWFRIQCGAEPRGAPSIFF